MVNITLDEKTIAENISGIALKQIIYEFLLKNKLNKEQYLEDMATFLDEEPSRRVIYSNEFVEYCIDVFEDEKTVKPNSTYNELLQKANVFKNNTFSNIMNETKNEYGYDFGFIQDQIWYELYPKYL